MFFFLLQKADIKHMCMETTHKVTNLPELSGQALTLLLDGEEFSGLRGRRGRDGGLQFLRETADNLLLQNPWNKESDRLKTFKST